MRDHRNRWRQAQDYERRYWRHRNEQVRTGETSDLGWYEWRAKRLVEWLEDIDRPAPDRASTVLEIGSGPVGIISHSPGDKRVGLDPLERFFRKQQHLVSARQPGVYYLVGRGERVPLEDSSCNLVIAENCIDHVIHPSEVMNEIRRVLSSDGLLYLSVNARSRFGYLIHRGLSKLRIDPGHPHTYTQSSLVSFLENTGFHIMDCRATAYLDAVLEETRDDPLKGLLKGVSAITEMPTEVIASPAR